MNSFALEHKERFYEEHGAYVALPEGQILFVDGAIDENSVTGLGRLIPPPADDWERSQLVVRYWEFVTEMAAAEFEEFRAYLKGHGRRKPEWVKMLYTEKDQLAFLRSLQTQARRANAKLSKARRAMKDAKPAWIAEREREEAEQAQRRREFMDEIESITL